jgi:hypothetical protein
VHEISSCMPWICRALAHQDWTMPFGLITVFVLS